MTNHFAADSIELSIVIPAFNEADNIPIVIRDTVATLDASELRGRYELLLVNDGSTDDSARVVDAMAQQYPCVRAFHHERNGGMGEALKTGYRNSRGVYVSFTAADGEVHSDQVLKLYREVGDADMITSTRLGYAEDNTIRQRSFYRGLLTWGFQLCARIILGFDVTPLTGISLFRGAIVRSLTMQSHTSLVNLELLMYCKRTGARLRHTETTVCRRLSGQSKIAKTSGIVHVLREMIALRRRAYQKMNEPGQGGGDQAARAA